MRLYDILDNTPPNLVISLSQPNQQDNASEGSDSSMNRNPFVLPTEEEVFRMRAEAKAKKAKERVARRKQKVDTSTIYCYKYKVILTNRINTHEKYRHPVTDRISNSSIQSCINVAQWSSLHQPGHQLDMLANYACGQLFTGANHFPSPLAHEKLTSRDRFGCLVPRHSAHSLHSG